MILFDKTSENVIAQDVELADNFWSRFRGLMFRRSFKEGEALLFEIPEKKKFSIHMFFVFFSIDLVYLDEDFRVVEIEKELSSFHIYFPNVEAKYLIELPTGVVESAEIETGDEIQILQ